MHRSARAPAGLSTQPDDLIPWPRGAWLGLSVSLAITAAVATYIGLGLVAGGVVAVALGGAAIAWWQVTWPRPEDADARRAAMPAVVAAVICLGLLAELYTGDFAAGVDAFDARALIIAGYSAVTLTVTGSWLAWRRHPMGEYGACSALCFALVGGLAVAIAGVVLSPGGYPIGFAGGLIWAASGAYGVRRWLRSAHAGGR